MIGIETKIIEPERIQNLVTYGVPMPSIFCHHLLLQPWLCLLYFWFMILLFQPSLWNSSRFYFNLMFQVFYSLAVIRQSMRDTSFLKNSPFLFFHIYKRKNLIQYIMIFGVCLHWLPISCQNWKGSHKQTDFCIISISSMSVCTRNWTFPLFMVNSHT